MNVDVVPLSLRYREWSLGKDSDRPGYIHVIEYFKTLIAQNVSFQGTILDYDAKRKRYFASTRIDSRTPNVISILRGVMFRGTIEIIGFQDREMVAGLLKNFNLESTGIITDNQVSPVFINPVEWNNDFFPKDNGLLLVIYHDGDPLFTLENI